MAFLNNITATGFFKKFIKRRYELDQVIAVTLVCLGMVIVLLSIMLRYYRGITLTAAVVAGALVYLVLKKRLVPDINLPSFQIGSRILPLCHIVFVISLALMVYVMRSNLDYRPPVFFILVMVAAASIILNIFALDETSKPHIIIALFKIIILSLTVFLSIYHEFPGIWGIDAWLHNQWAQETINLGHITPGESVNNDYFLFPLFHILSAIMQIITNVSTYDATFLGTDVLIAVSCLFVFLIGAKLVNVRMGLIAALIVSLTDQVIMFSTNIIAMTLGYCFFTAILYLILGREKRSVPDTLLVIIFSIALVLTHTVAALVTLLSIITIYAGIKLYQVISKTSVSSIPISLTMLTFFGLFMLFRWMQPDPNTQPFFDANLTNLVQSLQSEAQFVMAGASVTKNVASAVTVFDDGGYTLLLALGVTGCLTYLHHKHRTAPMMALIFMTAFMVVVPQILYIFSVTGLLPDRWFVFLYVALSIMVVSILYRILSLIPGNIARTCTTMIIVLAGMFMMITSSRANSDSPMVFNGAMRIGYTQAELVAVDTLSDIGSGRPVTDRYYYLTYRYLLDNDRYDSWLQQNSRVFVQRNYYLHHPEWNKYTMVGILGVAEDDSERSRELITAYKKVWGIDSWPIIYRNNNVVAYANASLPAQYQ